MSSIVLEKNFSEDTYAAFEYFIDKYLPISSGENVKVYLYLLRATSKSTDLSGATICKDLGISEQSMLNSLRYWENIGLIRLNFTTKHKLSGIVLTDPPVEPLSNEQIEKQIENLENDSEFNLCAAVSQQYFSRPLNYADVKILGYWYIKFNYDPDMIEYLVDYCANKCRGRLNMNYIEAVAQSWYQKGLLTIDEVRQFTRT